MPDTTQSTSRPNTLTNKGKMAAAGRHDTPRASLITVLRGIIAYTAHERSLSEQLHVLPQFSDTAFKALEHLEKVQRVCDAVEDLGINHPSKAQEAAKRSLGASLRRLVSSADADAYATLAEELSRLDQACQGLATRDTIPAYLKNDLPILVTKAKKTLGEIQQSQALGG